MVIAFYNPISEDFYNKLNDSCTLNEKIDVFVENIHEFLCPFFMLFRSNIKKGLNQTDFQKVLTQQNNHMTSQNTQ